MTQERGSRTLSWTGASYADWAARARVPLHFVVAAIVLWLARPTPKLLGAGALLVGLGLWVRGWAAGHLRRELPLSVSGPYAHLRHPLYFGSAIILAGFALACGRAWAALLLGLYFVLLFIPVMGREERERRARAPELYPAYAAQVPAFLPRLRPARFSEQLNACFDSKLYWQNREWRGTAGCALLLALLYAKAVWG